MVVLLGLLMTVPRIGLLWQCGYTQVKIIRKRGDSPRQRNPARIITNFAFLLARAGSRPNETRPC